MLNSSNALPLDGPSETSAWDAELACVLEGSATERYPQSAQRTFAMSLTPSRTVPVQYQVE